MDNEPILLRIDPFIWDDPNLGYPEKIIVNLVLSFTLRDECCKLTNEWIASKFGWTPEFVNDIINLLATRKLLVMDKQWNGTRNLSFYIPGKTNPCEDITTVEATEINP